MPIIGVGTYSPSPVFNAPRQYLGNFATHSDWTLEHHVDGQFIFNDFTFYNDRIFVNLRPSFWDWNSNSYLLEEIVYDAYYYALPSLTPLPFNFSLTFIPATSSRAATIRLLNASFSSALQYFPLPPVDRPYWSP